MYQRDSFTGGFKRGFMRMPVVIRTIIAINVIVFIFQAIFGGIQVGGTSVNRIMVQYLAFDPSLGTALTQP